MKKYFTKYVRPGRARLLTNPDEHDWYALKYEDGTYFSEDGPIKELKDAPFFTFIGAFNRQSKKLTMVKINFKEI